MSEFTSSSPQRPLKVLGTYRAHTSAEVSQMAERGRAAQREWARRPPLERAAAMRALADALAGATDELVALGVAEVGKPVGEMRGEIIRGVGILRYYAESHLDADGESFPATDARSLLVARRRPHGLVGVITPWNFPVAIPLWKIAPALACGNAVLFKPSPEATAVGKRLVELFDASLPEGLVSLALGGAEAGRAVVEEAAAVSFTGSAATGSAISALTAPLGKPMQAEMGGQNASVVLDDADPGLAARVIAAAAMSYAGQKCTATSRIIVVGDAAALTEALAEAVKGLPLGDPAEPSTVVGPLITERARRRVTEAAEAAAGSGARLVTGGRPVDGDGWFVEPVLLDRVDPDSPVAQEEVFGPIAVVLPASSDDEAIRLANGVRYGLAGAVFTSDLERALRFTDALEVGLARVNGPTTGVDFHVPFGGVKASSLGPREQGKAARDFYTWTQTVTITPAP